MTAARILTEEREVRRLESADPRDESSRLPRKGDSLHESQVVSTAPGYATRPTENGTRGGLGSCGNGARRGTVNSSACPQPGRRRAERGAHEPGARRLPRALARPRPRRLLLRMGRAARPLVGRRRRPARPRGLRRARLDRQPLRGPRPAQRRSTAPPDQRRVRDAPRVRPGKRRCRRAPGRAEARGRLGLRLQRTQEHQPRTHLRRHPDPP